jgi:hypothetical protein
LNMIARVVRRVWRWLHTSVCVFGLGNVTMAERRRISRACAPKFDVVFRSNCGGSDGVPEFLPESSASLAQLDD